MTRSAPMWIAVRRLIMVSKKSGERKSLTVRSGAPWQGERDEFATCTVRFEGLLDADTTAKGVDTLQALQLATDIDAMLAGFNDRFDFFCADGDPYEEVQAD